MGIFSLFGKKDGQPVKPAEKDASRAKRPTTSKQTSSLGPAVVKRDSQAALTTAMKIDAIESEMSSEFVRVSSTLTRPTTPGHSTVSAPPSKAKTVSASIKTGPEQNKASQKKPEPAPTLQPLGPDMGTTTEFLLGGQTAVGDIAAPSSEAAAVIEEAAIMYANDQNDLVAQMLQAAISADNLGSVTMTAWWMLFDLYQITGKQQEFENLSIEFANKFETSPPGWINEGAVQTQASSPPAGTTPMVPFSAKLDAGIVKQVERIQKLAENYSSLRLEFNRVTEVHPEGCSLLLDILSKLHKSGHDLVLVGALDLLAKIQGVIEVGRRDNTEDAWLLLLEILRLLNREKEFEEISIDYCVTFEVSPPAFEAPKNKVTTAVADATAITAKNEGFLMPAVVEGRIDSLIVSIASYADEHNPAVIDCSQLIRVDFAAAGRLLTGLAPFCGVGKAIEFHHVNYLVVELFNIIGLKDIVRIVPRKN